MAEDVSCKELYRIINRALSKWGEFDDVPADCEIKLFNKKYNHRRNSNPQIDIFESPLPSEDDVKRATQFCSDIETYREITDIYSQNDDEPSVDFYRRLYKNLEFYAPYIQPENEIKYKYLTQNLQKKLPEYQTALIIDAYSTEIDIIKSLHKRKDSTGSIRAKYLFNQMMNDESLKQAPASAKKLSLYEKSLDVVACLSKENYSRSAKFALKRNINLRIKDIALQLGTRECKIKAERAQYEVNRYQNAIDKAKQYSHKKRRSPLSTEERNQRALEEYWYR